MDLCLRSLLIGLIKGKCPIGRQEKMGETSREGVDSGKQRGGDARGCGQRLAYGTEER